MLDIKQLHRFVVRPALAHIGLAGIDAERLVIGTALTESGLVYLDQKGRGGEQGWGPALGLWQMKQRTFDDHMRWAQARRPDIYAALDDLACAGVGARFLRDGWRQLAGNLFFAAAMCRVHYFRAPERLPIDMDGMAAMWKLRYNSPLGAGREIDFKTRAAPVMTLVQPIIE